MARIHAAAFMSQRPWSAEEFHRLRDDPMVTLVTRPEGFALFRSVPPEAELLTLAVLPAHRRQGIATALLAEADPLLAGAGITSVFLEVAAGNTAAIALYDKLGFQQTGHRANYYRHPDGTRDDAVLMARQIPAQSPNGLRKS